ncbi:hypothetical protein LTR28_005553 [Elasticomyces elasticus]|nr:hypothetical protein LTR28_005553 [Elasticomyces elasticus]
MEPTVHTSFEKTTGTWQYIVADPISKKAVIIDSVLDYNPATNSISTATADELLRLVKVHGYTVDRILETHVHADHLTASRYLQSKLSSDETTPDICIGAGIAEVHKTFGPKFGVSQEELEGAFDHTFQDMETFPLGTLEVKIMHLPGHTPDHVGYMIGSYVFTGDSIFNPDVGSARCDFPKGSATALWASTQKLLALPPHYRLYTGHDYPPATRESDKEPGRGEARPYATVAEHKAHNKHVKDGTVEEQFVQWRTERDATLSAPRLLNQALQVNIRAGRLPVGTADGTRFILVPLQVPAGAF